MGRHALDPRLESAPCGFVTFGDDGIVRYANRTLLEQLDYESADVIGHHVERLMTVGTRIFYQTHWFPMLRMQGATEEIFVMLRGASGEQHGMLVNTKRREEDGTSLYDCVLMRVVERQKFEDELLRARKEAERARAEADRARIEAEQQREEVQAMNDQLIAQAVELEEQQQQLHDQAAELEASSEELRATNDELLDRTLELEDARATAEEANRAKSTFLAVMSHELRTPLNAIAGYTELIDMGLHGPVTETQHDSLDRIKRSQRHLLRLINEILNLARIEAGRVDYVTEAISAESLAADVMPMVEPQLRGKGQTFEVIVSAEHVVLADREKVQQILLNLLSNAIKFTPSGGHIALRSTTGDDGTVTITVSDTGIGIPAVKLESVFDPFVQVDMSHTSRTEGSGLGLAISRDLARGMDGDLTASSVEGRGSEFVLHLPSAPGSAFQARTPLVAPERLRRLDSQAAPGGAESGQQADDDHDGRHDRQQNG